MKHNFFVFLLVFFNFLAHSQQNWLTSYGGSTSDEVLDASVDQSVNLLMLGYFTGANNFGSSILQRFGNSDIVIIKTNSTSELISAINADIKYDSFVIYNLINDNGCTFSDSIDIQYQNCELVAPIVFTPNNDLVNDVFYFKLPDGEIEKITIFNRWGNLIHTSEAGEWNGMKNNDLKAADGIYFYILEYTLFDNTSQSNKVTLR